jgi:hypothetical protein
VDGVKREEMAFSVMVIGRGARRNVEKSDGKSREYGFALRMTAKMDRIHGREAQ